MDRDSPIILYDGVCGLCNGFVRFVAKRDKRDAFRFASLQSPFAAEVLTRHGKDPQVLSTIYVVLDHGKPTERLLAKARAALFVFKTLGGPWGLTRALRILPTPVLNVGYDLVARFRYRLFGKHESCPMPDPAYRRKFLEFASNPEARP